MNNKIINSRKPIKNSAVIRALRHKFKRIFLVYKSFHRSAVGVYGAGGFFAKPGVVHFRNRNRIAAHFFHNADVSPA